jgi:hypothetical protein
MSRRLAFLKSRPRDLLSSAEEQLAFLERDYEFEAVEGGAPLPHPADDRHPDLAKGRTLLTYRRGDEVLKLTRHTRPFLPVEAIFLEWFPSVMPQARYLYTGVIEHGTRDEYDRELAQMIESLEPDLKTAHQLWRKSVGE